METKNAQVTVRKLELVLTVLHRLQLGLDRVAVVWLGALLVIDQRLSLGKLFASWPTRNPWRHG